jgi:hypothetical protein
MLTLIERKTIAGSAVQDVTFASLNGDVDVLYLLTSLIKNGYSGATSFYIYPNNQTSNTTHYNHYAGSGHGIWSAGNAGWLIGVNDAIARWDFCETLIWAKTGLYRLYVSENWRTVGNLALSRSGHWTDTATNITSLVIHADRATGIDVGSIFTLYKLPTS